MENVVAGNLACDFAQLGEGETEIFGEEIGGKAAVEAIDDAGKRGVGVIKGGFVALVGDKDGVVLRGREAVRHLLL